VTAASGLIAAWDPLRFTSKPKRCVAKSLCTHCESDASER
jgi:hypothetical protein